jgi:U3 small nucleolar RNA-associated protein 19
LIGNLENDDENKIYEIMDDIKNILSYYLMDENIKSSNEVIKFFQEKIELIYKILNDIVINNEYEKQISKVLNIFNEFLLYVSNIKRRELFHQLLEKIIINIKESKDISIIFYTNINHTYYNDIFECLNDIINSKKMNKTNELINIYNFIVNIKDIDSLFNNDDNEEKEKKKNDLKEKYQNLITNMLNEKYMPIELLNDFMKILNKKIIQNVNNPIIFSDYLLKKTSEIKIKSINDYDIQIFGLSSLFVLLTKYNLEYDKYYELLYKLISQKFNYITIFDSKHKNRILKLLELSLSSEQIPYVIICSFIKKLLRICLLSKAEVIYSLLSLVMKVIQLQPRTLNLLMDNKSKKILKKDIELNSTYLNSNNEQNLIEIKNCISLDEDKDINIKGYDNFDDDSTDPFNTNADNCSLWELYTFSKHYNMNIRKLVNKFSRNFLAKEIAMEIKAQNDMYFDIQNLNAHFYINN